MSIRMRGQPCSLARFCPVCRLSGKPYMTGCSVCARTSPAVTAWSIDYVLRRWPSLAGYARTGHISIDNNPVENAIRPIAPGKIELSILSVANVLGDGQRRVKVCWPPLNGLEPAAWLKDTLEKLPAWLNRGIDELLSLQPIDSAL